ncbi:hypothetical protein SDC9_145719 [bioreactor metagenome]|uniref:Uncharacterized protein n=1 Tax=bioreactor metagenome TaxID=1076179 RepID=A0A645EB14_9ZZZZ
MDARDFFCLRGVDGENFCRGIFGTQGLSVQHSRHFKVACVNGCSHGLPRRVLTHHAVTHHRQIAVIAHSATSSAANCTAFTILVYPVHRHRFPDRAVRISASVG